MRCYKGFIKQADGTLKCREFVYEEGKTYERAITEDDCIEMGFQAAKSLYQCWYYFPHSNENIVYHEVECEGIIIKSSDYDGKVFCSKITVGKEVAGKDLPTFICCFPFGEGFGEVQLPDGKVAFIDRYGKLFCDGSCDNVTVTIR